RGMDVAHLEARALSRQTARPERAQAPLVGDLTERVGLVHELRQLRAAKVLFDHGAHGLGVDQVVRHQRVDLLRDAHALLDCARHAHQTDPVLVLHQLANRAHAPIAEVIDVVDRTLAVLEVNQVAYGLQDVVLAQDGLGQLGNFLVLLVAVELVVELQSTDRREIVALGIEEQIVEELLRRFERGRVARTETPVDLHDGVFHRLDLVRDQRVPEVRSDVQAIDEQHLELGDPRFAQALQSHFGDLFVALEQYFAGFTIDDVFGADLADHIAELDGQAVDLGALELLDRGPGELGVLAHDDLVAHLDVGGGTLPRQEVVLDALLELPGL